MFIRICFCLCIALLVFTDCPFALSEADYKMLKETSDKFRAEDQQLGKYWKELMSRLDDESKQLLRKEQREWLKSARDAEARTFMAGGMSKADAYAKATQLRANQLRVALENSYLSPEEAGRAKADDFYNASEEAGEENARPAQEVANPENYSGEGPRKYKGYVKIEKVAAGPTTGKGFIHYDLVDGNGKNISIREESGDVSPLILQYSYDYPEIGVNKATKKCLEEAEAKHLLVEISGQWSFMGEGTEGFNDPDVKCRIIK